MIDTYQQVINVKGSIPSIPQCGLARVCVHTRTHEGAGGRVRVHTRMRANQL
jgi:hypothetical protein